MLATQANIVVDVRHKLSRQSGDERVMDEPTNDFDIETLELLEELLLDRDGTRFLMSHDRAFLDNVVT
jgi:ATP-binding cassette subfamily F protein uup